MRTSSSLPISLLPLLLSLSCAAPGGPGEAGSGSRDFNVAYVVASNGALEIVLGNGDDVCESRIDRAEFERDRGLRIRLLAVGVDGELLRNTAAFYGAQTTIEGPPPIVRARNAFVATRVPTRQTGRLLTDLSVLELPVATDGDLTLARAPDYDTGAVDGYYELLIDRTVYQGAFVTRYCPGEEDLAPLAADLWNSCGLTPEVPYAPGSSEATVLRDIERGLRALALSREERVCWQNVVQTYCIGGFPTAWQAAPEGGQECLVGEFDACIGALPQLPTACNE